MAKRTLRTQQAILGEEVEEVEVSREG